MIRGATAAPSGSRTDKEIREHSALFLGARLEKLTIIREALAAPEVAHHNTVSTPSTSSLKTFYRDLRPQQKTIPVPENMLKRPNVLCCYGMGRQRTSRRQKKKHARAMARRSSKPASAPPTSANCIELVVPDTETSDAWYAWACLLYTSPSPRD